MTGMIGEGGITNAFNWFMFFVTIVSRYHNLRGCYFTTYICIGLL